MKSNGVIGRSLPLCGNMYVAARSSVLGLCFGLLLHALGFWHERIKALDTEILHVLRAACSYLQQQRQQQSR